MKHAVLQMFMLWKKKKDVMIMLLCVFQSVLLLHLWYCTFDGKVHHAHMRRKLDRFSKNSEYHHYHDIVWECKWKVEKDKREIYVVST